MAVFNTDQYRNVVLVGHSGSGKTSLAEALLHKAGVTNRLGSVTEKTSILDFLDEEKEKQSSHDSAVCSFPHNDLHVNLIDTPGINAFTGPATASIAAAELAIVVVSATAGIQVNTRKLFNRARQYGLGVWFVVSHIDSPNIDLEATVNSIKESFGAQVVTHNLPQNGGTAVINCMRNKSGETDILSVEDIHTELVEAVVGSDDALMEKYLNDELSDEEARQAAAGAVASGDFMPLFFVNSTGDVGVTELKDAMLAYCPCPDSGHKRKLVVGEEEKEIEVSQDGPFIGQVFKVSTDPKSHIKYVHVRVHSGKLTPDMNIKGGSLSKSTRPGHVLRMLGASHSEIEAGVAGDIVALAKLDLHIGDTISVDGEGTIPMPTIPNPMYALALESKSRGDEDKIGAALRRFEEEDPCFIIEHRAGGELVARGMGELQLRTYFTRMSTQQKLEVTTKPPRIPYMETISRAVENVEYTHKKQSGGSGEFGRVIINMLPAERGEGYEFVDKIFGGSIDQAYRPSVDKGCRSEMDHGVLAGYPVVDVKVELIDGKTHPVDSKDSAFQKAGRGAFREAFLKAKPVLLEPIVHVEVTVPSDNVGDITGDLASRRGRPQGQDVVPGNMTVIQADVPLAELSDYNSRLSSITGGQGSYSMELSHYEQVPSNIQQQIVDAHAKELEAVSG